MAAPVNTNIAKTNTKVYYLDGIRGLAALLVFFHHFGLSFYPAYYDGPASATHLNGWDTAYGHSIFSFLTNGNFCVCIFFVLSGFVLSRKYFFVHSFDMLISAAQRRYLRLFIPVSATLLLSYFLVVIHAYYNIPVSKVTHSEWWLGEMWRFNGASPLFYLIKCLVYKVMLQGNGIFDGSMWTMSIELLGSLFVFSILALTHRTRNKLLSLIIILLACLILRQEYMCAFVLGITLNYADAQKDKINRFFVFIIAVIFIPCGLILGSFPSTFEVKDTIFEHMPFVQHFHNAILHVMGSYIIVLSIVITPAIQRFFSLAAFRFLGYVSFSFYLLHLLVIGSLGCYTFLMLQSHFQYNIAVSADFFLTLLVSLILAYFMTKYIDALGIRYAKTFYERWIKEEPGATLV